MAKPTGTFQLTVDSTKLVLSLEAIAKHAAELAKELTEINGKPEPERTDFLGRVVPEPLIVTPIEVVEPPAEPCVAANLRAFAEHATGHAFGHVAFDPAALDKFASHDGFEDIAAKHPHG